MSLTVNREEHNIAPAMAVKLKNKCTHSSHRRCRINLLQRQWFILHHPNDGAELGHIHNIKIVFEVPKITRTARTLYEIKGVIWEYSYELQNHCISINQSIKYNL